MTPGNASVWHMTRWTEIVAPVTLAEIVMYGNPHHELCVTAELPWQDNRHGASCIRAGLYPVSRHPTDPLKLRLHNVPGRELINVEHFNFPIGRLLDDGERGHRESEGCIGVGDKYTPGHDGVLNSVETLKRVRAAAEVCFKHGPLFLSVTWDDARPS